MINESNKIKKTQPLPALYYRSCYSEAKTNEIIEANILAFSCYCAIHSSSRYGSTYNLRKTDQLIPELLKNSKTVIRPKVKNSEKN